jgi:RimJ/RimL family protein N-acetyltransferase
MVKEFPVFKKIFVITGSAYKEKSSFQDLINSDDRIIRYNNLNEEQMLSVMMSAHLAIVPASSILLEVLAAKCLAISGFYVDNQKFLYENLRQLNAFTDAYDFNPEILRQSIFKALSETKNVPALIDGQSPFRIKKCFTTLRYDNLCFLRKVTPADLNLTYSWASDPIIRKYSFQAHEISMEVHTEWFNRKILDLNCYFFILVLGEEPVGSIRFDISSGIAIISYLVDSKFHGKGFGQVLLKKGIEQMLQIRNENKAKFNVFSGSVMFENIGSRKAFERLGFSSAPHEGYLKFELSI